VHTIERTDPFEWNEARARANRRRHGLSFADAVGVFEDAQARTRRDVVNVVGDRRFITLGRDRTGQLVVVAYTKKGARIRIESVRAARPCERRDYISTRSRR
jgi:uncharacterized DUF497 family protein